MGQQECSPPTRKKAASMKPQRNLARRTVSPAIALLVALLSGAGKELEPVALAQPQVVSPSWTFTGNLKHRRWDHMATLLPSGKVLVVGGLYNGVLNSAELYDPATETWTATGNLNVPRPRFTATLLA